MASFDQNWKISLLGLVFAFGSLKLFRFHFSNFVAITGEMAWASIQEPDRDFGN